MAGDLETRLARIELELDRLARQQKSIRREHQQLYELVDTVRSPIWKRLWWLVQGYRLFKVGRWYRKTDDLK